MSTRTRNVILFLLLGAALIAAFAWSTAHPGGSETAGVLDAVPSDAQVVVAADMKRIRESPYRELFASNAVPDMVGGSACGQNLSQRVEAVALWTPADPGASFGVAASAPVSAQAVWDCARDTISARGGKASRTDVEGFQIIVDEQLGPGAAEIAISDLGLLLLARPTTRSRMMDALARRTPRAGDTGVHAAMLSEMRAAGSVGDLTLTVIVHPPLRKRFAEFVGEATPILDGVERLGAVADLRVDSALYVTVWCAGDHVCAALAEQLESRRRRISASLAMRAVGIASLADGLRVEPMGARLRIQLRARADQVLDIVRRLGEIERILAEGRIEAPAPRGSDAVADEVLRPVPSR